MGSLLHFLRLSLCKVEGNTQALKEDYQAAVLHSANGNHWEIKTTNSKVNRLFQNILWGQKSNF